MWLGVVTLLNALVVSWSGNTAELPCRRGLTYGAEQLLRLSQCDASLLADGRVSASCRILVRAWPELWFIPSDPEVMTLEEELLSDTPVHKESGVCLSLTRTTVKKWDDFPADLENRYMNFNLSSQGWVGPVAVYALMVFIKQCEVVLTFQKPVHIAVANCSKSQASGGRQCDVYGIKSRFINYNPFPNLLDDISGIIAKFVLSFALLRDWNLAHVSIKVVNVTFAESVKSIPSAATRTIAFLRVARFVYWRCNFKQIKRGDIAHMRYLNQLDFFYAPLSSVHPDAFDLIPDVQGISLVGTELGSVPNAIFSLRRLHGLNMAATRIPPNATFQFCPEPCAQASSVTEFVLAGTHVWKLHDRALCAFPSLRLLDLSACSIGAMEGSPFVCLQGLRELHLRSNQIASLSETAYKGMKRLEILDLKDNRLSVVSDPAIFGHLESLKSLYLSSNKVHTLERPVTATSVRFIDLSNNRISNWTSPLFSLMGALDTLIVSSNTMYTIDNIMLRDLRSIGTINVSNNPWDCDSCLLRNLQILLNSSARASADFA